MKYEKYLTESLERKIKKILSPSEAKVGKEVIKGSNKYVIVTPTSSNNLKKIYTKLDYFGNFKKIESYGASILVYE